MAEINQASGTFLFVTLAGILAFAVVFCAFLLSSRQNRKTHYGVFFAAFAAVLAGLIVFAFHSNTTAKTQTAPTWEQNTDFSIANSAYALELIDAALADERSALPDNFRLNNDPVMLTYFNLGFIDGKFFVLKFKLAAVSEHACKGYQIGPDDCFFVDDSGRLDPSRATLPVTVVNELLTAMDEERFLEERIFEECFSSQIEPQQPILHIQYHGKFGRFETHDPLYTLESGSLKKAENCSVDRECWIFFVTLSDQCVWVAVV